MSARVDARLAQVDDYTSGLMSEEEADRFEEDLFAAAADARAETADVLAFTTRLARAVPTLAGRPGLVGPSTREEQAKIRMRPHVHYLDVARDAVTEVKAWPEDTEIVVYRVDVDLRGYEEADVVVTTDDGKPVKVFRDVQWDPADGALYAMCAEPLARVSFRVRPFHARVEAVKDGERVTVARLFVQPV